MKHILETAICLLSALIVFIIGCIGSVLSESLRSFYKQNYLHTWESISFVLREGGFILALFPFVMLFIALAINMNIFQKVKELFWHLWVLTTLSVTFLVCYIVIGLVLPNKLMMTKIEEAHPVVSTLAAFNMAIFVIIAFNLGYLIIQSIRKKQDRTKRST